MIMNALKCGFFIALFGTPGVAQEISNSVGVKYVKLLQGWKTSDGTHMAAVQIALESGWKTYWRAPGSSGIPPVFDWAGSENIKAVEFHWPAPMIYEQYGIRTIGYKDNLILPIEIEPINAGKPVKVISKVDFGVCSDVCIPATSAFQAELQEGPFWEQALIKTALEAQPLSAKDGGIKSVSCAIDHIDNEINVTAKIIFTQTAPTLHHSVIESTAPNTWIDQIGLQTSGTAITAQARIIPYSETSISLEQDKLRVTLIGYDRSIEINGCTAAN